MEGKELFDDIMSNPFKYLNKIPVNIRYYVYATNQGTEGAFSGVLESIVHNKDSRLDTIRVQSQSRSLKVQRWAIKSIEIDPKWQQCNADNEKAMQILLDLSNRISRLENILKSLSDLS